MEIRKNDNKYKKEVVKDINRILMNVKISSQNIKNSDMVETIDIYNNLKREVNKLNVSIKKYALNEEIKYKNKKIVYDIIVGNRIINALNNEQFFKNNKIYSYCKKDCSVRFVCEKDKRLLYYIDIIYNRKKKLYKIVLIEYIKIFLNDKTLEILGDEKKIIKEIDNLETKQLLEKMTDMLSFLNIYLKIKKNQKKYLH